MSKYKIGDIIIPGFLEAPRAIQQVILLVSDIKSFSYDVVIMQAEGPHEHKIGKTYQMPIAYTDYHYVSYV